MSAPDEPKPAKPPDPTTKPADQMPAPAGKATAPPGPPPVKRSFWERMRLRQPPSQLGRAVAAAACVALILLVWLLLTTGAAESRAVSPTVLPSPGEAVQAFHSLWFDAALTRNLIASLWRVLQGFGLAVLFGVPLGIVCGAFPRVNAFIAPLSIFGRNVPISALVPLTLVWFGIDEMQKVMFIFVACVMFIVFDAARAVTSVAESYVQTALTLGAKPLQILLKVLIPLALPEVFGSLRLLFGVAFGYIIVAEMVNAEYGLGHLILLAQRRGPLAHVYLVLIVITIVAFGIDRLLLLAQRWLFPYREVT
jgi:NitT/TauT family transport system permease protein